MALYKSLTFAFQNLTIHRNIMKAQFKSCPSIFLRGILPSKCTLSRNFSIKSTRLCHCKGFVKGVGILSLRSSIKKTARILPFSLPTTASQRLFHVTQPKRAVPPLLWVLLRPFASVAAVLFGRTFRKIWQNLPQEKRNMIITRLKHKKRQILGKIDHNP